MHTETKIEEYPRRPEDEASHLQDRGQRLPYSSKEEGHLLPTKTTTITSGNNPTQRAPKENTPPQTGPYTPKAVEEEETLTTIAKAHRDASSSTIR